MGKGENVTQKLKFVFEILENIVGKGKIAGFQHFLTSIFSFSHNVFKQLLSQGSEMLGSLVKG